MYRLSDFQSDIIRKQVSKGLLVCMENAYMKNGEISREQVSLCLENYGEQISHLPKDPFSYSMIKKKLEKMIEEIKDKEYQYTFDELGEALLFFAIIYRRENLHKFEPIYFELEDLRDMYTELIRIRGDEDYSPEHWNMLAKAIVEPAYIFELVDENCPYMLIFWDFDFLYVVEYGPEIFSRFANSPEGQHYRFIACNKDSEPVSGSIKCQLDEEW